MTTFSSYLGFHSVNSILQEQLSDYEPSEDLFFERVATWGWNISQVINYIPILGVISGIFHLILGIINLITKDYTSGLAETLKGVFLIGTLGFGGCLLILPDLIVSVKRYYKYNESSGGLYGV